MEKYTPGRIEKKWQEVWQGAGIYQAEDFSAKPKFYCLVEFPYPSGAGLHVGHVRSWSAMDAYSRKKRMEGFNVLFPMGWDAFGLPAENYAIKMGVHPSKVVPQNIARFKKQCQSLGLSFDWSREIDTTSPAYYKWTQWIFVKLFEKGLAYQDEVLVNWCPSCRTNLADEEIIDGGKHERCGQMTERRPQKQWLLRITRYGDRLLEDLKDLDYSRKIALQQINWIGRKQWVDIVYPVEGTGESLTVSTTRPETNFGATFVVVAPEHPLLDSENNLVPLDYRKAVGEYLSLSQNKSELERISAGRQKTGVFTGLYCFNRLSEKRLPIWVADFVLSGVGTGAVVGVPAHDIRDFEFAQSFGLPVIRVVTGPDGDESAIKERQQVWEGEGKIINSGFLDGLETPAGWQTITDYLEKNGWGRRTVRYHLRDWIFSRQHYWGEPIPIIHCGSCGPVPVPEDQLPVELPYLERYQPSQSGQSPLSGVESWVNTTCPKCGHPAKRETDTMPNWAGSNWYFIRYCDSRNDQEIADRKKTDYWLPVDLYQGGFEHTTLHLLYSRFIHKFLFDIGAVSSPEPYQKRRSHGVVLGPDGRKMSKSFGNVINPDEIVERYGADTLRLYEMFVGPFDQMVVWNTNGVAGIYRFLGRVWDLVENHLSSKGQASALDRRQIKHLLASLVSKVTADLDAMRFNTAVSAMMEFINEAQGLESGLEVEDWRTFLKVLAPFAPHLTEELWQRLGGERSDFHSIHLEKWPVFEEADLKMDSVTVIVQVNGKIRGRLELPSEEAGNQSSVEPRARGLGALARYLSGQEVKKTIFVSGKLINFVV